MKEMNIFDINVPSMSNSYIKADYLKSELGVGASLMYIAQLIFALFVTWGLCLIIPHWVRNIINDPLANEGSLAWKDGSQNDASAK